VLVVEKVLNGWNKHQWQCFTKNKTPFWCPAVADVSKSITPPVVVTIKHNGFFTNSNGRPKRARIIAIRYDISVDQFYDDSKKDKM